MKQSAIDLTIGYLVSERAVRAKTFERFGLDYCCGGNKSLGDACKEKGLDPIKVLSALSEADATNANSDATDWRTVSLTELADHIEATHHSFLRQEFPRLKKLTEKVVKAHAEHHPELVEVAETLGNLETELMQHMMKEEQILFPLIRQMESSGPTSSHCGSIGNPIRVMEQEHAEAGNALSQLQTLTKGYKAPEDACGTYRVTMASLAELEEDLHLHIHKENSILFPRAIALEEKLLQS